MNAFRCRSGLALIVAALACVGAGCAVATSSTEIRMAGMHLTTGSSPTQRAATFLSFVPACACGSHTMLSAFSLKSGRLIRNLGVLSNPDQAQVSTPMAENGGRLLITATTEERCALSGNFAECPRYKPNSCTNRVEAVGPGAGESRTVFTVTGSRSIGIAVPSPDGSQLAFAESPCSATPGSTGLYAHNLSTDSTQVIASTDNPCDSLGQTGVSWNAAGTQVVFAYDTSTARPTFGGLGNECSGEFRDRLAIASVSPVPHRHDLTFIKPAPDCAFVSAAFDTTGIVAAEGCSKGSPLGPSVTGTNLGDAYLLQLNPKHQVTHSYRLKRGLEQALVVSIPRTRDMLVTQDQPANNGTTDDDWVWELHGTRLRPIAHYRAEDAAQVIAVPW